MAAQAHSSASLLLDHDALPLSQSLWCLDDALGDAFVKVDISWTLQQDRCALTICCPGGILLATSVHPCWEASLGPAVDIRILTRELLPALASRISLAHSSATSMGPGVY